MSTKDEIFNYVMHSPENTNPAVLGSMLNSAKELPDVNSEDEGKVLTVNDNGKWAAIMPESVIDDSEKSATKTYSSNKIEALIPEGLPTVTSSDVLKGLQVNNSGKWEVGYIDIIRNNQCGIMEGSEALTVSLYKALTTSEIAGIQFLRIPFDSKTLLFCAVDYGTFQAVYRETGKTTYYSFSISASTQPFTDIPVTKEVVNDPA